MKKNKGFTLIELLISISILSILVISFFNIVTMGIKSNTKNEKDIKAMNIAQSEIENIRLQLKSDKISFKSVSGKEIIINGLPTEDERYLDSSNPIESDKYLVKIELDTVSGNDSLYNLNVSVISNNEHLSKKETTITTQISGKSRK